MSGSGAGGRGGGGLLLADTPSLYFRSFYGVPRSVRAPDGTPVNAVRGLVDVLARQILEVRPGSLVACFDADWRPAFRVALVPSYKAHRVAGGVDGAGGAASGVVEVVEEVEEELQVQLPVIDAVLDAFGIARVQAAGFEADDVIGTLATRYRGVGGVDVLTGDRDLFQLVDDGVGVRVRYAVERFAVVDEASVTARYGIPGRAYADFAVLRGDPSDGLPGVAGIGAKTAAALLGRFGSLSAVCAAVEAAGPGGSVDGVSAAVLRRLVGAREYLAAAVPVVAVVRDVPLGSVAWALPAAPVDARAVARLGARFGISSACARLAAALATVSEAAGGVGG
ncbi:5'-3' exonuclease H3TH domain-containing protein [Frankia sp. R82]|uniref:5'-3' exonuclease n=1 Tax=Frankia sp. R82 TaxID=2950553 RepID=UPI00204385CE|nr:5'-3' exonuclease H3TH domain-containing protein [Frankia sp. R82]MCM3887192.1 flap endonuclease [Frankia sp. R82]